MSDKVTSQIDIQTIEAQSETDQWSQFRQIERITLELTQTYKYSLGKYSRFFIELENKKFLGTQCGKCKKVYTPPRPLCPDCLNITDWIELAHAGILKTFSISHFSSGTNDDVRALETPFILAYVQVDGADTLFPHLLKTSPDKVSIGMRVKIAFAEHPVNHPIHLMYFVPLEDE
jgi:uncharacterized protein